uniref:Uncharacterized protein n=1 Tax=Nelumbo nucifera TaxID=4432 RepID=A0A822Y8U7_NELNU|nr:TPA_asm: hypothetical protein HUJ06_009335 [Nelumbo nucifera]
MAAIPGIGLSWRSKVSQRPSLNPPRSSPRRASSQIKVALSVEKKTFTLQKSEEIFTAAKVRKTTCPSLVFFFFF